MGDPQGLYDGVLPYWAGVPCATQRASRDRPDPGHRRQFPSI
jgi:hypothetical protein